MRRFLLPVAMGLLLAGCSTPEAEVQPSSNVEAEGVVESDTLPAEANTTDVHFVAMMVPHHEQAIEMSDILLASDVQDEAVRDLAQRIRDGQARENEIMEQWGTEWGQDQAMELHSHHIANGMVNPTVMQNYSELRGEELRVRFLELMHYHHAEVIAMTQDEVDNGGYEPLIELGAEMIEVQTAEMAEMEDLLGFVPNPQ
ncbi:DUF305 domain-containing protein [Corynebacterium lubricantis]|uniref:DUF305 domain-containing protein n=1 Tax=Corynebacterium lubricantis TaxID=541095 RepID=UPI000372ADD4|nr:DUF305 domain-containing protein [Corynebacterium lubricantis]